MFSAMRRRMRVSPATVIAGLALVFAMTGGAYAAKKYLITSTKQISPSVLKSLQGKAGAAGAAGAQGLGPAGAQGAQGPAGPAGAKGEAGAAGQDGAAGAKGATGATGPKGATGANGTSGFTERLPSKKTETGSWARPGRILRWTGICGGADLVPDPPWQGEIGESNVHFISEFKEPALKGTGDIESGSKTILNAKATDNEAFRSRTGNHRARDSRRSADLESQRRRTNAHNHKSRHRNENGRDADRGDDLHHGLHRRHGGRTQGRSRQSLRLHSGWKSRWCRTLHRQGQWWWRWGIGKRIGPGPRTIERRHLHRRDVGCDCTVAPAGPGSISDEIPARTTISSGPGVGSKMPIRFELHLHKSDSEHER